MYKALAVLAVVAVAGMAFAAAPTTKPAGLEGAFVKMDGAKLVMKVKDGNALVEKTVLTTEKTTVKIGDADGKLADLKEGQRIAVILDAATTQPTATAVKARAVRATRTAPAK